MPPGRHTNAFSSDAFHQIWRTRCLFVAPLCRVVSIADRCSPVNSVRMPGMKIPARETFSQEERALDLRLRLVMWFGALGRCMRRSREVTGVYSPELASRAAVVGIAEETRMSSPRRRQLRCVNFRHGFEPTPRLGDRRHACSRPECQEKRRRRTQASWWRAHPGYFIE